MFSAAVSLWELFSKGTFVIPDYQRNYAWTNEQLEDLWNDIEDNVTGTHRHFMGTVIIKELKNGPATQFKTYELVDGQQRLTSLTILVTAACRRLWDKKDDEQDYSNLANYWYNNLVCGLYNGTTPDSTLRKLKLGSEDDAYFWQAIISPKPSAGLKRETAGQRRLSKAYDFFDKKLEEKLKISQKHLVEFLHKGLGLPVEQSAVNKGESLKQDNTGKVLFLVYEVENDLDVGLIFETINARGKQLSQLDKIKNYLMYLGSKANSGHLINIVNNSWGRILRNISEIDEEKEDTEPEENALVHFHWALRTGNARVYEVHKKVKEEFKINDSTGNFVNDAERYVSGLLETSDLYLKICRPDKSFGSLFKSLDPADKENLFT